MTNHKALLAWVEECARLCQPDRVYWCDGSAEEKARLIQEALQTGELESLNAKWPNCYYHRSNPNDVARTEQLTFICTRAKDDAGVTNHWMAPADAYKKLGDIFKGSMKGRTMYVVPFVMGVPGSAFQKIGVQLTDSRYVVLSMGIMTRMGRVALEALGTTSEFTRCLHGMADVNPNRRFICHFPEDNAIWSVGSAYGGNALLGKKCLALRIGSYLGKTQGWMAEHMMVVGIEDPQGEIRYIAAAFPSQCGKTNLAMLRPPKGMEGYKLWTVGDDIAWLRIGADGRLWASNPENGYFGVAPGTSIKTNPVAMEMIHKNTIFTNVLRTDEGDLWWEGMNDTPPMHGINWEGKKWTPDSTDYAAHPNSRFTSPAAGCPSVSAEWENPQGVPLTAIFFGARRSRVAPLVVESRSWPHGVYLGATLASETTAAATGKTGVVRRDPMAMLPFIGYDVGEYFAHWLAMGKKLGEKAPKIFHVNWFRRDVKTNEFLWPGFGDNLRPILWALDRCEGRDAAVETPMGYVPTPEALSMAGLSMAPQALKSVLEFNPGDWAEDLADQRAFFAKIGARLPPELQAEQNEFARRLKLN